MELEYYFQLAAVKTTLEEMAMRLACRLASSKDIEALEKIALELDGLSPVEDFEKYLELDTSFHRVVRQAGRNGVLVCTIEQMQDHIDRYYYYSKNSAMHLMNDFENDFCKMIQAIKDRNEEAGVVAIRNHMNRFYELLKRALPPII